MSKTWKWLRIAGLVVHGLIAALLIFAASGKILALDNVVKQMEAFGLVGGQVQLIGVGELLTAILLLVPRTLSLGVLLASSLWGGAICLLMSHDQSYLFVSALLILTWVGAFLRLPALFSSFTKSRQREPTGAELSPFRAA